VTGFCEHGDETFGSVKHGEFWPAERLLASQEGLSSTDLVGK
jgi:hypothetical protein